MSSAPVAKTAHFVLHHRLTSGAGGQLSPAPVNSTEKAVDNPVENPGENSGTSGGSAQWGWVIPKRHARRSVTRNLLRRQMRALATEFQEHERFATGVWVLRLRTAFDVRQFPSAASEALRRAARAELLQLLQTAQRRKLPAGVVQVGASL